MGLSADELPEDAAELASLGFSGPFFWEWVSLGSPHVIIIWIHPLVILWPLSGRAGFSFSLKENERCRGMKLLRWMTQGIHVGVGMDPTIQHSVHWSGCYCFFLGHNCFLMGQQWNPKAMHPKSATWAVFSGKERIFIFQTSPMPITWVVA